MIGKSVRRTEDDRLLRGAGKFVDDHTAPNMLHAAIVRSPHAAARIVSLNEGNALAAGAHSVWFFRDLPALSEPLPLFREPATNPYCSLMRPPQQRALADRFVHYVGDPVAVVLADSPALAADAAEQLDIVYQPLDALVDPLDAMQDKRSVHDGQSNIVAHLQATIGDIEAAFSSADVTIEQRLLYPRITSVPLETRGLSADYDQARDHLSVRAGHQLPYSLRSAVARVTGMREQSVIVLCPDTGGAFGPKSGVYPEDILIPLLARTVGRPVKWIQTRSEFMMSSQHARDVIMDVRLAAKSDGTVLGFDVKIIKDSGAYLCWAVIEPSNTINHIPSQYRIPAYRAEAHSVLTNKAPSSPYRGTGRPEAVWAIERSLDFLGYKLGINPIDIRRRNMIKAGDLPFRPGNVYRDGVSVCYDTGDFPKVFEATLDALEIDRWRARHAALPDRRHLRLGIGVANYVEASGIGWPCEGATVKVDESGRVDVLIGVSQSGQGHETVFAQICADYLGVPFDRVRVHGGDTSLLPYGFGTGGSRVTVNTGNAVALAAQEVKRRARKVAAQLLQCSAEEVAIENGMIFSTKAPHPSVPWSTVVATASFSRALASDNGPGLFSTQYYYPSTVTWASGTHAAAIELNVETGEWRLLKYAIGHDCGRQINPMLVEGQVIGAFAQGLATAMGEEIVYAPDGQLLTGTLMDYVMPRAADAPELSLIHFEFPATGNPLGVRGVGEGNVGPVAAAIAGAIGDALEGRVRIRKPMMPSSTIFGLMRESESA